MLCAATGKSRHVTKDFTFILFYLYEAFLHSDKISYSHISLVKCNMQFSKVDDNVGEWIYKFRLYTDQHDRHIGRSRSISKHNNDLKNIKGCAGLSETHTRG